MVSRCEKGIMVEKATVRIHKNDKERLNEIAEATGQNIADVIAEYIREPAYLCPECEEPFDPAEVDPETIKEHGMLTTGADKLVKGQREVKSFECPNCGERVRPKDVDAADADDQSGVTAREMGVTEGMSNNGSTSKGA
jgi:predicted RNA-binding Zn-ribbon protein involved in translation (DUF1610 family)